MRRPTTLLAAGATALVGLVALTGCGDTTADEPTANEPTVGEGCARRAGETVTVEIPEFAFAPSPVRIGTCDSVVWENAHDQAHTSTGKGDKAWSTGNIAPGSGSDPVRFEEPGSFTYICALHPFMEGVVEVA